MSDKRFFQASGPFALGEIARLVGARLAEPDRAGLMVRDIAELGNAGEGDLSLFSDSAHAEAFARCHASAVVTSEKLSAYSHNGSAILLSDNPRAAFVLIGQIFHPRAISSGTIHPAANIAVSARIGEGVEIAAGAVIGENAVIGTGCRIAANAVIGDGVVLGENCSVGANTSISHSLVGNDVTISANTSIGGEGFGFLPGPKGPLKVSQLGRVLIGDGVDIGSNCAIDRGALGDTVIGAMTALDNMVHIAHNVRIGKHCMLTGHVAIAGSTIVGDGVMMGGQVGIKDHVVVGDGARIAARSGVMHDIAPGESVGGYPAVPVRQWHRQTLAIGKLIARKAGKE